MCLLFYQITFLNAPVYNHVLIKSTNLTIVFSLYIVNINCLFYQIHVHLKLKINIRCDKQCINILLTQYIQSILL